MRTKTRKRLVVKLRESAGISRSPYRVDRDQGIIYRVKVVGRESPNTHEMRNVDGTIYTQEALENALPLYEGLKVNLNHPSRKDPHQDRDSEDGLGKLVNCRIEDGEMYADLHILTSHPFAPRLFEAAEKMPDMFGLSHNASGRGEVKDGKFLIREIPSVRSVDLVRDPATTHGLFESREKRKTIMKTLRSILESSKAKKSFKKILESKDKAIKALLEEEYPKSIDEADEEGGGVDGDDGMHAEPGYRDHLKEAMGKLCESDDPEDHAKAKKIMGMLTDHAKPVEEADDDEGDGEPEDKDKVKDDAEAKTEESEDFGDVEKKAEKENKMAESLKQEIHVLKRKDAVRDLCESENFRPSKTQFEAMLLLPDDKKVKAFIQESKPQPAKKVIAPRTGTTTIRESQEIPHKADEFAAVLLS